MCYRTALDLQHHENIHTFTTVTQELDVYTSVTSTTYFPQPLAHFTHPCLHSESFWKLYFTHQYKYYTHPPSLSHTHTHIHLYSLHTFLDITYTLAIDTLFCMLCTSCTLHTYQSYLLISQSSHISIKFFFVLPVPQSQALLRLRGILLREWKYPHQVKHEKTLWQNLVSNAKFPVLLRLKTIK